MRRIILLTAICGFIAFRSAAQLKPIPSGVFHWAEMPVTKSSDREGRKITNGSTAELELFDIHATTQFKGAVAKPGHAQTDIEELIFVKEGTMKFTMGPTAKVLGKGSIILIPPHQMQAIENVGDGPLTYYVMMFRAKKPVDMERSAKAGGPVMLNADSLKYVASAKGGGIKYFDRPTAMLGHLEMHITELKGKGPSHAPHTHLDTELIIMLEGDTEMTINGKTYNGTAGDIYLANSNEMHGIGNAKDAPCKYLAIRWW
ncbi:cupin domain-containing protein [Mucilaginibacter sp. HMF5004]|uniref:cupin domain-containing protein n=1 Tax=Mucilaginibacter rivuli TaxID=2857527 RepID=UPI001C6019D0|nr:cupin domain-containing protein [Mucilaginibacter rivuli]MBW4888767.1 cupin domain-containing protein [Mucilaginibacter rivuli]